MSDPLNAAAVSTSGVPTCAIHHTPMSARYHTQTANGGLMPQLPTPNWYCPLCLPANPLTFSGAPLNAAAPVPQQDAKVADAVALLRDWVVWGREWSFPNADCEWEDATSTEAISVKKFEAITTVLNALRSASVPPSPRAWRDDPAAQKAHEELRGALRDYAIALTNDCDAEGKLAVSRRRQVNERLDALCDAVANCGPVTHEGT